MSLRLIIENLDGVTTTVPLEGTSVTIGRTPENSIQLSEQNVSRHHATLRQEGGRWLVEDVGSSNGVGLNGLRIERAQAVVGGDLIQIADYQLAVCESDQVPVRPSPATQPFLDSSSAELPKIDPMSVGPMHGGARDDENMQKGMSLGTILLLVACAVLVAAAVYRFLNQTQPSVSGSAPHSMLEYPASLEPRSSNS